MSSAYTLCITAFAWVGASITGIICLIYGILALVPSGPFEEKDVTFGVTFIVLSLTGVMELGGAIAGVIVGAILGLPIYFCLD